MVTLWIFCTALAASGDRIAASDGAHVWISLDGGRSWRRSNTVPDEPADSDDDGDDDDDDPIHAVAIAGDELVEGTSAGIWSRPLVGGPRVLRSPTPITALAASGDTLWAASDDSLLVGDASGLFRIAPLPDEPIVGLAATGGRVLAATPTDVWRWDGAWHRLGVGAAAVTADAGMFYLADRDEVSSSPDGERWTRIATTGARLVAVATGTVWVARGLHVAPLGDEPDLPPAPSPRARLERLADRAAERRWIPTADLQLGAHTLNGRGGALVLLTLRWELDRDEAADVDRASDQGAP